MADHDRAIGSTSLYGSGQSRFARYLERWERRRPERVARELRERLLTGLRGRVIEVGAGDGRSFEHYPLGIESLLAVEPDPVARKAAVERAGAVRPGSRSSRASPRLLPAQNACCDAAVVMGVLCTVSDVPATLSEIRRVLVPGGELRFWEHVRSGNAAFRTGGFEIVRLEHGFHSSSPLTLPCAPYVLGVARRQVSESDELRHGRHRSGS